MPAPVGDGEQKVAHLLDQVRRWRRIRRVTCFERRFVQLGKLFGDLGAHIAHVGPVESNPPGALAELLRTRQRRQGPRYVGEHASVAGAVCATCPLACLELLPGDQHFVRGGHWRRGLTEHMRMAPHQLVVDGPCDTVEVEPATVLGQPRVEHHLEQQVTEFIPQLGGGFSRLDGVDHLVGLLQRVGRDGLEGLDAVPGAPVDGIAQLHHQGQQLHHGG